MTTPTLDDTDATESVGPTPPTSSRRRFLGGAAAVGAVGATLLAGAPAIAQDVRRWKMVTAWPKNLPGPGVAAQMLADRITTLSGGRIEVQLFAAGEIVPGNGVFDAVSEGHRRALPRGAGLLGLEVEAASCCSARSRSGCVADEQFGWLAHGGGQALYDEMYARFGLKPFLCGNSGPQWQGWFREEIADARRSEGAEVPQHRARLRDVREARHGRAGDGRGRHVPGAAIRGARRRRVHRALDRQRARLPPGGEALLLAGRRRALLGRGVRDQRGRPTTSCPRIFRQAVAFACESLYNPVWTEYTTKTRRGAGRQLVDEQGVQVRELPERTSSRRWARLPPRSSPSFARTTTSSCSASPRASSPTAIRSVRYMSYADNGQMNARAKALGLLSRERVSRAGERSGERRALHRLADRLDVAQPLRSDTGRALGGARRWCWCSSWWCCCATCSG